MKETEIIFERRPPVAVLTLNRPQFHNALTWAMYENIVQNCAAVESDPEIRVMIVRGAGDKAFASGTDISQFNEVRNAADGLAYEARIERAVGALEALSKPTIAAIIGLLAPDASCCHACPSHQPPMLGAAEDLPLVLRTHVVDELIVASLPDQTVLERLSRWCAVRGVVMNVLVEVPSPAVGVWNAEHFGEGTFLFSLSTIRHEALDLLAKRVVDLLGAAIGLLVCGAAYVWYGMRLHRETGDSVLFRQLRVGENGRRFMLYKFRTMYSGSEQCKTELDGRNEMKGPIFKLRNDPRVTRTGRRLLRRHLDELPQFWNVLKGEMSLVGTRPPTENEAAVYSDHHQRRLSIKPGLTGLWQLSGNGAVKDFEEVVKLDCEYIDNWSLWLDFTIVARTIAKVVRGNAW